MLGKTMISIFRYKTLLETIGDKDLHWKTGEVMER